MNELGLEQLGYCLHSALRKCCDSEPTSILWNIVHFLPEGVWNQYLVFILPHINTVTRPKRWVALKKHSLEWEFMGEPPKAAMHCTFKLFTDDDWQGYATFIDGITQ